MQAAASEMPVFSQHDIRSGLYGVFFGILLSLLISLKLRSVLEMNADGDDDFLPKFSGLFGGGGVITKKTNKQKQKQECPLKIKKKKENIKQTK